MLGAYKKHPQAYLLYVEDCFLWSDNADMLHICKRGGNKYLSSRIWLWYRYCRTASRSRQNSFCGGQRARNNTRNIARFPPGKARNCKVIKTAWRFCTKDNAGYRIKQIGCRRSLKAKLSIFIERYITPFSNKKLEAQKCPRIDISERWHPCRCWTRLFEKSLPLAFCK